MNTTGILHPTDVRTKTIPKLVHSYKDGKCTVCGMADPNYVPADQDKPKDDSAQPSDDSNIALWIAIMLASGMGLTATAIYGRRKHSR